MPNQLRYFPVCILVLAGLQSLAQQADCPIASFGSSSVCLGMPSVFTDSSRGTNGSAIVSHLWDFGDNTAPASVKNPEHLFAKAGDYTVTLTVTSESGCRSTTSRTLAVHPSPRPDFSWAPNPIMSLDEPVLFTDRSFSAAQWSWKFGDPNNSASADQTPSFTYPDTGKYTVKLAVVSPFGCRDTVQKTVEVNAFTFYIPNAFTPNGDGVNDYFCGTGLGIDKFEMWVFDRWGNLQWHANDINQKWDGKAVSEKTREQVNEDVYVWLVKITDIFQRKHKYVGHVSVVR